MAKSLIVAINEYFGRKPGQTMKEFAAEIRKLTEADRVEFCEMLSKVLETEVEDSRQVIGEETKEVKA